MLCSKIITIYMQPKSLESHPRLQALGRRSTAIAIAAACMPPNTHINTVSDRPAGYFFNVIDCLRTYTCTHTNIH